MSRARWATSGARRPRLAALCEMDRASRSSSALALYFFFGRGDGAATTVRHAGCTRGDITVTVTATGNLEPRNQVDIGSELSGTMRTVNVDVNDEVKAGQVLAVLDTTRLNAQVLQAESSLASAQARVIQSEASAERSARELSTAAESARAQRQQASIATRYGCCRGDRCARRRRFGCCKSGGRASSRKSRSRAHGSEQDRYQITDQWRRARAFSRTWLDCCSLAASADIVHAGRRSEENGVACVGRRSGRRFRAGRPDRQRFTVDAFPNRTLSPRTSRKFISPRTTRKRAARALVAGERDVDGRRDL